MTQIGIDAVKQIVEYKQLLDDGVLTDLEYNRIVDNIIHYSDSENKTELECAEELLIWKRLLDTNIISESVYKQKKTLLLKLPTEEEIYSAFVNELPEL